MRGIIRDVRAATHSCCGLCRVKWPEGVGIGEAMCQWGRSDVCVLVGRQGVLV